MEIYISINGVLRNLIQKFDYHYVDHYLNSDEIGEKHDVDTGEIIKNKDKNFEYNIIYPICNDSLLNSYQFRSKEEFEYFFYIEFPIEIYGHAGLSYVNVISQINNLIYENKEHNFTIVGLDELGRAKPSTLFFLSKNGFIGNNIKFITSQEIPNAWNKCDYWITDEKTILDQCPENKTAVKFNTPYNQHFTNSKEITKLNEIEETWLKSLEKTTTLTLMESPKNVE